MAKKRRPPLKTTKEPLNREATVPTSTASVVRRFREGDESAAAILFERYFFRLAALARARISAKLAARMDAEDVVQSAYRSFFVRARDGQLTLAQSGDLWRLLVQMTLHKLYRQAARHLAQKRSVRHTEPLNGPEDWPLELISREPDPAAIAAVADEIEAILQQLPPAARPVIELRLQGEEQLDIARRLNVSERTVRRWLDRAREIIRQRNREQPTEQSATKGDKTSEPRRDMPHIVPAVKSRRKKSTNPATGSVVPSSTGQHANFPLEQLTLQRMIGAGASGKVYRARLNQSRKSVAVAVKFLRKSYWNDRVVVDRFLDEAELIMKLKHRHILPSIGCGRAPGGGVFLVTELARSDLHRRITRGRISVANAIQWVLQAASAVQYAHEHDVIHCDLKPANLLLGDEDQVLLGDFGLAHRFDLQTGQLVMGGTPAFMAPEQISGAWGKISVLTDVFGLGAVLFSLLTGQPPFAGDRIAEVVAQVVSAQPCRSPRELRPRIPTPIANVCTEALQKNPHERFASVSEFAAELAKAITE